MNSALVIFVIIFFVYLSLKNKNDQETARRKLIIWGCTLLAIESGLRHIAVGPDTIGYYANYCINRDASWAELIAKEFVSWAEWRDGGYPLFAKLCGSILYYWHFYLLFICGLYYYAVGSLLVRYSETIKGVLLAFALLCSLFHVIPMSGTRQQLTMTLSMFLIPLIEDKKWKPVLAFGLVGCTLHISMLFTFLFIPLMYLRNTSHKKLLAAAIAIIPVVASMGKQIVGFMASFIANDYYSQYAQTEQVKIPIVYILICSIISVFVLFNYKKLSDAPRFFTASVALLTFFMPLIVVDGAMIRIGQYYTIYLIIVLPYLFNRVGIRDLVYASSFCILLFYIYIAVQPYYLFFQDVAELQYWYGY